MSQNIAILTLTAIASSAVSTCRAVGFDGAQATTLGQKVLGVAQFDAVTGEPVTLDVKGTTIIEAAEAIAVGDELTVDATGKAAKPTLADQVRIADALQAATAAGDKIEVLLR